MKKNCSHDYRQCLTFVLGLAIQLSLSLNTLSSRCIFVQQRPPDILTRPFVTTPNNFRKHGGDARPFGNPREHRNGNYLSLTPMFSYLLLHEPLARPLFSYKQTGRTRPDCNSLYIVICRKTHGHRFATWSHHMCIRILTTTAWCAFLVGLEVDFVGWPVHGKHLL